MVPNSRIVPPPSIPNINEKDSHNKKSSPYTPDSSLKEVKSTRYLSRIVPPPPTTTPGIQRRQQQQQQPYLFTNTISLDEIHQGLPPIGQQQQVKRKPLGDLNNSAQLHLPNNNSYHHQHQKQQQRPVPPTQSTPTPTTSTRRRDPALQSPPLSPPLSSSTSTRMPRYDSFPETSFFQGQDRSYSTDALTADDAKKKPTGRKGFGKFFKKLGKQSVDDDEAPQVRTIGNVVSVKSSRSYHNIPLAPPPPPLPPVTKQPDDLIAIVPQEYGGQLNSSSSSSSNQGANLNTLPQQQHNQPQSIPLPSDRRYINTSTTPVLVQNNGTTSNFTSPTSIYHEPLKDHGHIDRTESNSSSTSLTPSSSPTPTPRWSVSTRKSSVSYSIYSTFGGDSSFTSQEALDSTTATTSLSSSSYLGIRSTAKDQQQQRQELDDDLADIEVENEQQPRIADHNNQHMDKTGDGERLCNDDQIRSKPTHDNNSLQQTTEDTYYGHKLQGVDDNGDNNNDCYNENNDDNLDLNEDDFDEEEEDDDDDDENDDDIFVDATEYSQDDMERERFDTRLSKRLSGGHYGSAGGLLFSIEAAQRRSRSHQHQHQHQQQYQHSNEGTLSLFQPPPLPTVKDTVPPMMMLPKGSIHDDDDDQAIISKEDKERLRQESADALTGDTRIGGTSLLRKDSEASTITTPGLDPDYNTTSVFDSHLAISSFWNENPNLVLNGFGSGLLSPSTSTQSTRSAGSSQLSDNHHHLEAKEMAELLWNEDESYVTKDHMAEWLGTRKPLNSQTLIYYMEYFDFVTLRLDSAFRKLCGKLYFKAEAQQIDRILDVFAKRYWKCNPQSIFGNSDVVYAVVYSLLLLNTDLHVAQGNYARMTKQAFVKNTMSTIYDQSSVKITKTWAINMESYLKDLYNSVKQNQILQPMSDRLFGSEGVTLEKRSSLIGGRRVLEMKRSMGAIIRKSMHEPSIVLEESEPIVNPVRSPSSPLSTSQQRKRDSFSSVGSGASSLRNPSSLLSPHSNTQSSMISPRHSICSTASALPYTKEGLVVRKHLLENATQKAKHRDWRECFLVVGDGELKMYAIQGGGTTSNGYQQASNKVGSSDTDRRSLLRSSGIGFTATTDSFNGNKWGVSTQLVGTMSLGHSLANVLPPPGYNRQRSYVFAIQQAHGGVYLFQAGSQSQVNEWASTCNYWAARQSKEPLPGGVSNMEYGWGNCLHDVIVNLDEDELLKKEQPIGVSQYQQSHHHYQQDYGSSPFSDIMVYDWRPPAPPSVASTLDEKEQYNALQKHLTMLNSDINEHREVKKKMMIRFPTKHSQHTKVMSNWELKSKYLLHEIIKYQNYCNALEKSIGIQD
ncbi:hypothetical protein BC941DRAFT_402253 [Chlamydoabsidia padenii]|nr:hypothetical protein BC941DRAFT_402253 [Chlamydoabsidia padenii]